MNASQTRARDIALAALGGGMGSLCRYGLDAAALSAGIAHGGTWAANGLGCLLMGITVAVAHRRHRGVRHFWATGLLGGLTTFSAVNVQTLTALRNGDAAGALFEFFGMCALCLLAARLGAKFGGRERWRV